MVPKTISEQILAFLIHIFPQEADVEPVTNDEGILEEIILAAMEVMTSLSHESNLLSIPIARIINRFLNSSHEILNQCNEAIINIYEVKPKAIGKYHLESTIPQILLALLSWYSGGDSPSNHDSSKEKDEGYEQKERDRSQFIISYIDILNNLLLEPASPYKYLL